MRPSELIYLPRREAFVPETFTYIESHKERPDYDSQVRQVFGYADTTQNEFTVLVRQSFFFLVSDIPSFLICITASNAVQYQMAKDLLRLAGFTDVEVQPRQDAQAGQRVRDVIGHPLYHEQVTRLHQLHREFGQNHLIIKQKDRWNVPTIHE